MRLDGIEPSLDLLLPVWTPVNLCHSWIKVQSRSRTHIPDITGHFTIKLSELCDDKKGEQSFVRDKTLSLKTEPR